MGPPDITSHTMGYEKVVVVVCARVWFSFLFLVLI